MYFYSLIENCQLRIAALKFEFGCGFYFCVISALKYIIGLEISKEGMPKVKLAANLFTLGADM